MKARLLATLGTLLAAAALAPGAFSGTMPDDWLLPADHHVPAKMPMHVVHPRNAESADWAIGKNAHPGVRWEIPVVVQGGAWPFRYEIIDNGGADGLSIGSELERVRENGFIVHRMTDDYGRLWWNEPQTGQYEILLRVTDQELDTVDVPISLTVGTAGWVFVDADNGSDTNDGSVEAPFQSIQRVHEAGAQFDEHRVYLAGTVPMDGNTESGNLRIACGGGNATPTPAVWLGWPGRTAVLEAYEGRISADCPDFYLGNLEHRHHADYYQDDGDYIHMITAWDNTPRLTLHDVHFSRFQGNPVNTAWGNSSIIMFVDPGNFRPHVAVVNNRISGDNGVFTSAYRLLHAVFENNRAEGANFIMNDNSTWAVFWIKRGDEFVSLRANHFGTGNQWGTPGNLSGALGLDSARNIEFAYNTIYTPYDAGNDRRGALKLFTGASQSDYTWTEDTPVWIYRNSIKHRVNYEGSSLVNMPDGNVISERNVLAPRSWPEHEFLHNVDNLDQDDYFDADMKLQPPHREAYLGRYGAEIAEPDIGQVFRDRFESGSQR